MLHVLMVEDDEKDATKLQQALQELTLDIAVIRCQSSKETLRHLSQVGEIVDIFFLDVELDEMDGFQLAEKIRSMEQYLLTPIVFVTGHELGALNAFREFHCYSYILKPFTKGSIEKEIGILLKTLGTASTEKKKREKIIYLEAKEGDFSIYAKNILYIETIRKSCIVHTRKRTYQLLQMGLERELAIIGEPSFMRCHKSFAVNLTNVSGIEPAGRNLWRVSFNEEPGGCLISSTYYKSVLEVYLKMKQSEGIGE